jgi:D-alanyl-D-alanine carboxypeptidase
MASITKVMTALLVLQSGDLNRVLTVPSGVLN